MKRLKIFYISLYLPMRNVHGGGNRMFEQVKHLSSRHDVYVLSFLREWEEAGVEALRSICKEVVVLPIAERTVRSYSLTKPGFVRNLHYKEMQQLISEKIQCEHFDIIQYEYLPMAQYFKGSKGKSILTEHQLGFLTLKKELTAERNWLKKPVLFFRFRRLLRYEHKILRKFNQVIFLSGQERSCFPDINAFVSPMGVDTEYFKPDNQKETSVDLIFTGNFDNAQNVDSVKYFRERIWPVIKKKKPDITLQIAGYKSDEKLNFLDNCEGVRVLGYVDDLRSYIAQSRVFIMPGLTGGGMRGKLLEALAMAKPVVSSSIGAEGYEGKLRELIKIADSPADFAGTVVNLLDDRILRNQLGDQGRTVVEKDYSWNNIFGQMDGVYEN